MKIKKIKKIALFSGIAFSSIFATSLFSNTFQGQNFNNLSTENSKQSNISSSNLAVTAQSQANQITQDLVYDNLGTSFAYVANGNSNNKNVIKVDMRTGTKTTIWANNSNEQILAINYLQGSLGRKDLLLVLTKTTSPTNQLKLNFIDWNSQDNNNSVSKTINVTNSITSPNLEDYFISVNNFIDVEIEIIGLSKDSNNTWSFGSLQINSASGESGLNLNLSTLGPDLSSKFFSSDIKVIDFYSYQNSNFIFLAKPSFTNKNEVIDNFGLLIKVDKGTSTINKNNLSNLPLNTSLFFSNKQGGTGTTYNIESNITPLGKESKITLSIKNGQQTSESTNILNLIVDNENISSLKTQQFISINNQAKNLDLKETVPLYGENNQIIGYISLFKNGTPSNSKIIYFSNDFTSSEIYYDSSNSTPKSNDFQKIITRKNDRNWYGLDNNGKIHQFSGKNYIGELTNSSSSREEIIASISFKNEFELNSLLRVQKATDSNSLTTFLNAYAKDFINVESYDSAFGEPIFSVEVKSINEISGSQNKNVLLEFSQHLRTNNNGNINQSNKEVILGVRLYEFVNDNVQINIKDKTNVPYSITSKLPSEVTKEDLKWLVDVKNGLDYKVSLDPNDIFGTLTLNFTFPHVWVNGKLVQNYKHSITIGSPENPYFKIDILNGLSGKVDLVTDDYLSDDTTLKNELSIKYNSTLPSQVTPKDILSDFLKFGSAFSDMQLLNQGLIEKPTEDDVSIVPVDTEGYAFVNVTIPKIADRTNVLFSFKTAKVFDISLTSHQNSFILFKDNKKVLETEIQISSNQIEKLGSYLPSTIATQIQTDAKWLLYFTDISYYILNMIYGNDKKAELLVEINDGLGQITISIVFTDQIPGMDGKSFSKTFTGFATQGSSGAPSQESSYPTFNWGEIDSNTFNGKIPSDITVQTIQEISSQLFVMNGPANGLKNTINVTPLSASGAVQVDITFHDWWEKRKLDDTATAVPVLLKEKKFSTILTHGLRSSKESIDTIVWKSYEELDASIKASTAENALLTIESSGSDSLSKLLQVANVSQSLQNEVQKEGNKLDLSITANNDLGTLSVYALFRINGTTQSFGTTISGFTLQSTNYSVSLASNTSTTVEKLREFLPSELSDEQIGSLITVDIGKDLTKKVETNFDDMKGTLNVRVSLLSKNGNGNSATPTIERTYTGFKTNIPKYKGTNFLIVGLSIIIPILLLLPPILLIVFYFNRRDVKKFNKLLESRLSEQMKKKKVKEINSIEDLLTLDKD